MGFRICNIFCIRMILIPWTRAGHQANSTTTTIVLKHSMIVNIITITLNVIIIVHVSQLHTIAMWNYMEQIQLHQKKCLLWTPIASNICIRMFLGTKLRSYQCQHLHELLCSVNYKIFHVCSKQFSLILFLSPTYTIIKRNHEGCI